MIYTVESLNTDEVLIFTNRADAEEMCLTLCKDLLYGVAYNMTCNTTNMTFSSANKINATVTNPKILAELVWRYSMSIPLSKVAGFVVKEIDDDHVLQTRGYNLRDLVARDLPATAELEDARGQP